MAPSCASSLRTVPAFVHFNLLCSFLSPPSKSYRSTTLPIDTVLPSDTFHFKIFTGFVSCCVINTVFSAIFTGYGPPGFCGSDAPDWSNVSAQVRERPMTKARGNMKSRVLRGGLTVFSVTGTQQRTGFSCGEQKKMCVLTIYFIDK